MELKQYLINKVKKIIVEFQVSIFDSKLILSKQQYKNLMMKARVYLHNTIIEINDLNDDNQIQNVFNQFTNDMLATWKNVDLIINKKTCNH